VGVPADDDSVVQALHLRRALLVVVDAGLVEAEVLSLRPRTLIITGTSGEPGVAVFS
jgi:hypothetical protein